MSSPQNARCVNGCTYSKSMIQTYPRTCLICGVKENLTSDVETIMKAIRTLDDVGRFSENLDYVIMAGEALAAIKRLSEKAWKYEELCK